MIAKGEPWGHEPGGAADQSVEGDDAALATAATRAPKTRIVFTPTGASDFAKAVGIAVDSTSVGVTDVGGTREPPTIELPCDLLRGRADDGDFAAVNMVVVGKAPDRQAWSTRDTHVRVEVDGRVVHVGAATAVVIANGQYLRGSDVVPRGHPGDGRVEVHVYTLRRAERGAMRDRLATGAHVPHPRITTTSGRKVLVEAAKSPFPVEVDGAPAGSTRRLAVEVAPGAFSLLV